MRRGNKTGKHTRCIRREKKNFYRRRSHRQKQHSRSCDGYAEDSHCECSRDTVSHGLRTWNNAYSTERKGGP